MGRILFFVGGLALGLLLYFIVFGRRSPRGR